MACRTALIAVTQNPSSKRWGADYGTLRSATTVRVFDAYRRCKKSQTGFALSTIWLKEIKDRIELSGLQSAKEKAGAREQLKVNLTWGVTGRRGTGSITSSKMLT
jgi:hypothetical protein